MSGSPLAVWPFGRLADNHRYNLSTSAAQAIIMTSAGCPGLAVGMHVADGQWPST